MTEQQPRISVVRDNGMVPLMPACHCFTPVPSSTGVLVERHEVASIEVPEHEHRELCLHLQTQGDDLMEWWVNGRNGIERTSAGSIVLAPPGLRDRVRWQGSNSRLLLTLSPERLSQIAEEAGGAEPEFAARWSLHDPALERFIVEMGRQAEAGWPLGRLYADLVSVGLVAHLLRRYATTPVVLPEAQGRMSALSLRRVMEYMTEHLGDDLQLEQIAGQAGLSTFHFVRSFRLSSGVTPYQYLLEQRIDRARQLLRTSNWTVQEIGEMTGFHSAVNFVRSFRQRTGQTPGAWRRSD